MASHEIDFYFDYISPYAFLAHAASAAFCAAHDATLRPRPVLFAAMLNHFGQRGPAEIPPKREFTFKDVARRAARAGVALRGPKSHPFNPITALRVSLPEVAGADQWNWIADFLAGRDAVDPAALRALLARPASATRS